MLRTSLIRFHFEPLVPSAMTRPRTMAVLEGTNTGSDGVGSCAKTRHSHKHRWFVGKHQFVTDLPSGCLIKYPWQLSVIWQLSNISWTSNLQVVSRSICLGGCVVWYAARRLFVVKFASIVTLNHVESPMLTVLVAELCQELLGNISSGRSLSTSGHCNSDRSLSSSVHGNSGRSLSPSVHCNSDRSLSLSVPLSSPKCPL